VNDKHFIQFKGHSHTGTDKYKHLDITKENARQVLVPNSFINTQSYMLLLPHWPGVSEIGCLLLLYSIYCYMGINLDNLASLRFTNIRISPVFK
jgi:hypothetical protein